MKRILLVFVALMLSASMLFGTSQDFKGTINDLTEVPGTANHKRFMNAAGTDQEWALGSKVALIQYDVSTASGDVAITGVGFKPSSVIFLAQVPNTAQVSIGFDTTGVHYSVYNNHGATATFWGKNDSQAITLLADGSNYTQGKLKSFDADGFTITWTKTGSPTGMAYIYYLAFR